MPTCIYGSKGLRGYDTVQGVSGVLYSEEPEKHVESVLMGTALAAGQSKAVGLHPVVVEVKGQDGVQMKEQADDGRRELSLADCPPTSTEALWCTRACKYSHTQNK